jgi:N utilization substance protein B
MKRRAAREVLFALIFEKQFQEDGTKNDIIFNDFIYEIMAAYNIITDVEETGDIVERGRVVNRELDECYYKNGTAKQNYVTDSYDDIFKKLDVIDEKIFSNAIGFKKERISKVSVAVMRLCVYEMLYVEGIPFNISINEAMELAKKYDHDTAPAFINGILNKIADIDGLKSKL